MKGPKQHTQRGALKSTMQTQGPTPGITSAPGVYGHNTSKGFEKPADNGPGDIPCKFAETVVREKPARIVSPAGMATGIPPSRMPTRR